MSDPWSGNALDLDGSRVIDRRVYVDEDVFRAEVEGIFARTWQWVAHESEVPEPGDYLSARVAGRAVVLVRGRDGTLNTFFNTCSHRGAALTGRHKGNCGGKFTCMYHGWSFDATGRLVGVAWADGYGPQFDARRYDIPKVRVETFAGNVFVCLDPDAGSLEDFLGEAGPYLQRFTGEHEALGRVRWRIEGNWKLWHENFRDNYHPQFTHRQVQAQYRGIDPVGTNLALEPAHSLLAFPPQGDRKQVERMLNEVGDYGIDLAQTSGYRALKFDIETDAQMEILAVFPNLDYQCFLGGAVGNVLQVVQPVSVDSTVVEAVIFGRRGEPEEIREWRLRRELDLQTSAGKISGDDVEAAKRCTAGFTTVNEVRWSNMDRGQRPARQGGKHDEYSLRKFYEAYKQYMTEHAGSLLAS